MHKVDLTCDETRLVQLRQAMAETTVCGAEATTPSDVSGQETLNDAIGEWLIQASRTSADGRYRLLILQEIPSKRDAILEVLKRTVMEAHSDTLRYLRELAGSTLDPLGVQPQNDPAEGYPHRLDLTSLKGYFGESFAGIVAQQFKPMAEPWDVPGYLFRFHTVALQQLERLRQGEPIPGAIPGRTGDDFLAFQRDSSERIVKALVGEAKCTAGHSTEMISEAHTQISKGPAKPIDTIRLVDVLKDRSDARSQSWVRSLREFFMAELSPEFERCDLVSYVCGQSPVRGTRTSWLPEDAPHEKYSGGRRLQCVETHLTEVEALVNSVYERTT
jgi:hypothetical protein